MSCNSIENLSSVSRPVLCKRNTFTSLPSSKVYAQESKTFRGREKLKFFYKYNHFIVMIYMIQTSQQPKNGKNKLEEIFMLTLKKEFLWKMKPRSWNVNCCESQKTWIKKETYYSIVINSTEIQLNEYKIRFLKKSIQYNLLCTYWYWIINPALEAETAIGVNKTT